MLSASAFVPASPLLLASVNKTHKEEVRASNEALQEIADEWYAKAIETVVLLTQSRFAYEDAINIDVADPYKMDLESLGDLSQKATYHPDFTLIDALQRLARKQQAPITLSTEPALPFGCAAPLAALAQRIPRLRIVPIAPAKNLAAKEHYQFGILLKNALEHSSKRIGVLAAGDVSLSHLAAIKIILQEKSTASLLNLEQELAQQPNDTAFRPLSMLFGVLDNMPLHGELLSVESPFEVGYITATFA